MCTLKVQPRISVVETIQYQRQEGQSVSGVKRSSSVFTRELKVCGLPSPPRRATESIVNFWWLVLRFTGQRRVERD